MNRQETTRLLTMLASVWSGETIDEDKITVYLWAWEPFPYLAMEAAAKRYLVTGKFFPKPAELAELIAEQAVPAISTGAAMQLVQKQINRHGSTGEADITFEDPAIMEAVKAVGWKRICLEDRSKGDFVLRDFDAALKAAQQRQRRDVQDGSAAITSGTVTAIDRRAS